MKFLIKSIFNLFGLKVVRLNPPKEESYTLTVNDPIEFNQKENLKSLYKDENNLNFHHFSEERNNFYKEILSCISAKNILLSNKNIADIGCGTGHLLFNIAKSYNPGNLVGYEYIDEPLQIARKLVPGAAFIEYDIYQKNEKQFDIVFCTEVLEYLLYPWRALLNISEMIVPGGFLILTVPDGRADQWKGHINFWSAESWRIFLEQHLPSKSFEIQHTFLSGNILLGVIKRMN